MESVKLQKRSCSLNDNLSGRCDLLSSEWNNLISNFKSKIQIVNKSGTTNENGHLGLGLRWPNNIVLAVLGLRGGSIEPGCHAWANADNNWYAYCYYYRSGSTASNTNVQI